MPCIIPCPTALRSLAVPIAKCTEVSAYLEAKVAVGNDFLGLRLAASKKRGKSMVGMDLLVVAARA
ncbi:MAG: hypothetical protein N3A66_04635 [Planctomycetota bacterium]|nr:hypothetical protein [Planctomycetota bacterium]